MSTAQRMFYEWLEGMEKLRAIEAAYAPARLAISKEIHRIIMESNPDLPPDPRPAAICRCGHPAADHYSGTVCSHKDDCECMEYSPTCDVQ